MSDPRDLNGDGEVTKAEKKKWREQTTNESVAKDWGVSLALLDAYPGLRKYFNNAFEEYKANPAGFSLEAFQLGFAELPFFQKHKDAWVEDRKTELEYPELWEKSVQADVESLRDLAAQYGAQVTDDVLRDLAIKKRRGGLNDAQMQNVLATYSVVKGQQATGAAGRAKEDVMTWARANGLPASEDMLTPYLERVAAGDQTVDDVKAELRRTYLVGMYPAWADKIEAGYDPSSLFSPYVDYARKTLEDDSIGMDDPLVKRMTQAVGSDGKPMVVPLYEAQKLMRQDSRWQKTDNAYETYARAAQDILSTFGFR